MNISFFSGDVVACYSACMKFNTDEYCCRLELFTNYVIINLHITETPVVVSQTHALQTSGMWTILIRCLRPTVPRPTVMPMMTTPQLSFVETPIMISFSAKAMIRVCMKNPLRFYPASLIRINPPRKSQKNPPEGGFF